MQNVLETTKPLSVILQFLNAQIVMAPTRPCHKRVQPKRIPRPVIKNQNSNTNFPNSLHQKSTPTVNSWGNTQTENQNNNLFSFEELKNLTRADQFEVITSLACKFLYR